MLVDPLGNRFEDFSTIKMHGAFVLLYLVAAVRAAPYYTTTLVESPTSRFEQRLILSPQLHQTIRIRPQHIIPYQRLSFPNPELVYYHHGQQQITPQHSMNFYGLGQDSPFWQEWWNQLVSEQTAEGEEQGSVEESSSETTFYSPTKKPELLSQSTEAPTDSLTDSRLGEEESNKIAPKEEITTTAQPVEEEQKPEIDDTIITNSADQSQPTTTTEAVDNSAVIIDSADQQQKIESANENVNREPLQAPQQQIFTHNNKYYVINGPPQFYENFNERAPIFSLQELQPVVRTLDNVQAEKIAQFSMPSTEPTSTLRINVVDEDETEESAKDNDSSAHISPRSQRLPADDQNLEKEVEMSSDEEKREQSDIEGKSRRCLSDLYYVQYNHH